VTEAAHQQTRAQDGKTAQGMTEILTWQCHTHLVVAVVQPPELVRWASQQCTSKLGVQARQGSLQGAPTQQLHAAEGASRPVAQQQKQQQAKELTESQSSGIKPTKHLHHDAGDMLPPAKPR
jgi:hypothetical protein